MIRYNNGIITVNDKCIGCGRCMLECPSSECNVSVYKGGKRKLAVNGTNCIGCGSCLNICTHGAREYADDTERFLADIAGGEKISVILSTGFYLTFGKRARGIIGYLRSLGVNKVYDSGYGADIFVWLNAKYIKDFGGENGKRPFIMNACPAVTHYITRYVPDAVEYIIPVHTPPLCTAIYAQKYLGDNSKIAYISSCISRKDEFENFAGGVKIDYSVTFGHLMKYFGDMEFDFFDGESDLVSDSFGSVISASMGLREYVASLFSDDEIISNYSGLDEKTRRLVATTGNGNVPHPTIAIITGCKDGCVSSGGAGIPADKNYETYLSELQRLRRLTMKKKHEYSSYWEIYRALSERFSGLDPDDFYNAPKNRFVQQHAVPGPVIEQIFRKMDMNTEATRHTDCRACGYNTCYEMAVAVAKGYARVDDCSRYLAEEFRRKLYYDDMTGMLSAAGFHSEGMMFMHTHPEKQYIICTLNINGIKTINDLYNFGVGSQVISYIAHTLEKMFRSCGIIARLGGNNFVLCFEKTEENLKKLFAIPYFDCSRFGVNMPVTARFGLCEAAGDGDLRRITNYASLAMEKNTVKARNSFKWYDDKMREIIMIESSITSQMNAAMDNHEFVMYLQPQYNHSSGKLVGAETLCRWIKPDGSIISPGVFIPIFEKNGFIKKLDVFMWESAFRQIKLWVDSGIEPVPISVNISRMSLVDDEIIQVIGGLKEKYPIDPALLHFEITESAYMDDQQSLIERITKIREMGFMIAMDDFGSGYSSLNTLKDIPIDILKLDMGFLRGNKNTQKGNSIIGSVIRMAHSLGLLTVAEGVETIDQADMLQSLGCDIIQGYLYARPMPVSNYNDVLAKSESCIVNLESSEKNIDISKFFDSSSAETKMFEQYVGAAAVFEYHKGGLSVIRVNEEFINVLGYSGVSPVEFSRTFDSRVLNFERENIRNAVKRAMCGEKGAVCVFSYLRPDDKKVILRVKIWHIGVNSDRPILYVIADDVTDVIGYQSAE